MVTEIAPPVATQHAWHIPDPVTQVPKVDTSKYPMESLIDNILDELGNKFTALTAAVAGKVVNMTANAVDRVAVSASTPMDPSFSPSASTEVSEGAKIDSQARGKTLEITSDMSPSSNLGQVAQGRSVEESPRYASADISHAEYGNLAPSTIGAAAPARTNELGVC